MSRKPHARRNARIISLRREGISPRDIADELGISKNVVCGVLFRAGMTDPYAIQARGRGLDYGPNEKAWVLSLLAQHSMAEVSRKTGVCHSVLKNWIRRSPQPVTIRAWSPHGGYPREFRERAVDLLNRHGYKRAAAETGVSFRSIYRWREMMEASRA